MTALDYSAYPLGLNDIRLISLQGPAQAGQGHKARWKLEVANLLDPAISFHALSYTWGAPLQEGSLGEMTNNRNSEIEFDAGFMKVTANLTSFLSQVQRDPKLVGLKFWIDAISINQDDPTERSHQVSTVMAKIYRSAECVIAWLGDEDSHTKNAFEHIDALARYTTLPPFEMQALWHRQQLLGNDLATIADPSMWEATAKLFERTYWSRSWIIQEVVLPSKVIIRCGGESIDWNIISRASHNMSTGTWREYFDIKSNATIAPIAGDNITAATTYSAHGVPTTLEATRKSLEASRWPEVLLYTLIRSRNFKATVKDDKVYSLLGLIQGSVDIQKMPLLRPNFGCTGNPGQTYLNVAIQLLRAAEDLLLLACVEGQSFQHVKINGEDLPSWVPDWSCSLPLGLRVTGYQRYSADRCFLPPGSSLSIEEKILRWPAQVNEDAKTVTIRGIKIDKISFCGETKNHIRKGFVFPKTLQMLISLPIQYQITGEGGVEAFWRTLIANTGRDRAAPPIRSFLGPGFAKWFKERIDSAVPGLSDPTHEWTEIVRQFTHFMERNKVWTSLYAENDAAPVPLTSGSAWTEYKTSFSFSRHVRPFLTEKGYLGLGSENLKEGDTVWIVPRSRVPLIFRRLETGHSVGDFHCKLIGGTYLHGFMDGQFLIQEAEEDVAELEGRLTSIVIH